MAQSRQKQIDQAWHQVRRELYAVGLLAEGVYLDEIHLSVAPLPSLGEAGYVFDSGLSLWPRLLGYEEGVIYLPSGSKYHAYVPGGTLVDTIRHEYAHAWAWLDRRFINRPWFARAFDRRYDDEWSFGAKAYALFHDHPEEFRASGYYGDFVSAYAMSAPCEDFAETFMMYLRYRRSLERFRGRPGVVRKLRAVVAAVEQMRRHLGL